MSGEAFRELASLHSQGVPRCSSLRGTHSGRRLDALWWLKLLAVHTLRVSVLGAERFAILPPLAGAFVVVDEPEWAR